MNGNDGLKWPETMDAQVWAKEFVKTIKKNPDIPKDEGTMISWFANAIMRGWDTASQRIASKEKISYYCRYSTAENGENCRWYTDDYDDIEDAKFLIGLRKDMINPKIIKKFIREEELDERGIRSTNFPIRQEITSIIADEKPMGFVGRSVNKVLKFLNRHWDNSIAYFDQKTHK